MHLAAVLFSLLWAPPTPQIPQIGVEVEIVEVEVVVTDKQGHFVPDLGLEDFVLQADGKPQRITHFVLRTTRAPSEGSPERAASPEATAAPRPPVEVRRRRVVVAVDDLHLAPENLLEAKRSLLRFFDEQLDPEDEAAVATTSGALLEAFTTDRDALRRAAERLSPRNRKLGQDSEAPRLTPFQADLVLRGDFAATQAALRELLREDPDTPPSLASRQVEVRARQIVLEAAHHSRMALSALESIARRLGSEQGRKVLVLLSDGFFMPTAEHFDLRRITGSASRAGVVIYSLDVRGLVGTSPAGDFTQRGYDPFGQQDRYRRLGFEADREGLNALARDTGGLPLFNLGDLGRGLRRVLEDTESHYVLAYEPSASYRDGRYRKIEVKVPGRRGLGVRARKGYFEPDARTARTPAAKAPAAPRDPVTVRLQEGLTALSARRELPVELVTAYFEASDAGPMVLLSMHVDLSGVRFETEGSTRRADFALAGMILDEKGLHAGSFEDRSTIAVDEAAFEQTMREGFTYSTRAPLKPGRYDVRVAVLQGEARLGTASVWVAVPDLGRGGLMASDLLLAAGNSPAPRAWREGRRFRRGEAVEFVVFAYNARGDAEVVTDLLFETQVRSGGRVVLSEAPFNIVTPVGEPRKEQVAFSRRLSFATFEPGEYELRVVVTDRIAKTGVERKARFVVD